MATKFIKYSTYKRRALSPVIDLASGTTGLSFQFAIFQSSEASMNAQVHFYSFWMELQKLAMMLLMSLKKGLLTNNVMMKESQVKFKQTWNNSIRSNVMKYTVQKRFQCFM